MGDFEIFEEDDMKILTSYNGHDKKVVVPEGITSIDNFDGDFVFQSSDEIEEVVLPESLEYIGDSAFFECKNLRKVVFSDNVYEIGSDAFGGCENLEEINLPDNLEIIAPNAFVGCGKLKIKSVPSSLTDVSINSFDNTRDVLLKNKAYVELGDFMYNSESKSVLYALDADSDDESVDDTFLKDAVLPLDTKLLGTSSLSFGRFESISIPKSVEYIGTSAFMFCDNLKKITIPANVTTIDSGAFINCENLEEVVFEGNEPVTFGSMAFFGCPKLKSVKVPAGSDYEDAFEESVTVSES